jgi:RNA polymerase sigma-70 factor, ECF subfamily
VRKMDVAVRLRSHTSPRRVFARHASVTRQVNTASGDTALGDMASRDAAALDPAARDTGAQAAAWIAAIATRADRGAFAQLFRLYGPKVKGHLRARGASSGLADELTQEVMLTVWRKAAQFDPRKGTASGWLYAITRNRLLNHVRDGHYPVPEAEADDHAASEQPDDQLALAEQRRRLARALEALPPEQCAVLQGAYWRGQTLQECADEQRLPLGTVKTRVRLALARLRALLAGGGES